MLYQYSLSIGPGIVPNDPYLRLCFLQWCNKSLINQACSGPHWENIGRTVKTPGRYSPSTALALGICFNIQLFCQKVRLLKTMAFTDELRWWECICIIYLFHNKYFSKSAKTIWVYSSVEEQEMPYLWRNDNYRGRFGFESG